MRIFVTGATGFIGKYLCRELLLHRHALFLLARPTSDLSFLQEHPAPNVLYGDILDKPSLIRAIPSDCDICFHCAACVEDTSAKKLHETNVVGTENVFSACMQKGIPKIVHLSSVAVISGHQEVPLTDALSYSANNGYGQTKIEAEKIALGYRQRGLKVAVFRPSMVYGEGEPHLLRCILRLLRTRCLFLLGGGEYKWHLAYVQNVVTALMLALHHDDAFSGTYLVADDEVLTVREVFTILARGIGAAPPWAIPEWMGDFLGSVPIVGRKIRFLMKDRVFDISRIKRLGYRPNFTCRDALRRTAEYYRQR